MKDKKKSPLGYMMENREKIIETVEKSQSFHEAWEILIKKLPEMEEITKFNTFRGYMKTLRIVDKKLKEQEKLKEKLEKYEKANVQLVQEKESMLLELKKLDSENKLLKKDRIERATEIKKIKEERPIKNEIPRQIEGWGVQLKGPYYRLFKKINGKVKWLHIGKKWDNDLALNKIQKLYSQTN
ncbi:hypothetical protein MHK_008312 [Candidatus Magnetomorum sp. HK-1]|nr:hypothetical protein MHK_008312 [Candidatus Magnetomorum sp. HK-1]